jgi:hypothetical protein
VTFQLKTDGLPVHRTVTGLSDRDLYDDFGAGRVASFEFDAKRRLSWWTWNGGVCA